MRFSRVFPMFLWLFLAFGACDDGTGKKKTKTPPSLDQSTISIGAVRYLTGDAAGFDTIVTVHITDDTGAALPGIAVMPVSDRENDSFSPSTAVTDAQGDAVFHMRGGSFGTAVASAFVSTADTVDVSKDPSLASHAEAVFDVSLQVVPLEASYTWEKGDFTLRATLADEEGPVADASLTVGSSDPDLSFAGGESSATVQTNTSGTASFHVFSRKIGNVPLSFQLAGVEGSKSLNVPFEGPSAGGTVYMGQPYPAGFVSARAAAVALNMTSASSFHPNNPILGELTSESVCPCPEPSAFQLRLPIMPSDDLLIADPARQVRYNYFPIVVYDDLNNDHLLGSSELLLGARMSAGILYYAKPDGANPQGPLGWNLVSGLADEPQVLDWDFFNSSLDAWIRRAPFYEVHLHGEMRLHMAADRILFAAVDPFVMTGYVAPGPWVASMIDSLHAAPEYMLPILDVPIPSGNTYDIVVPAPELTEYHFDSWVLPWNSPQGSRVRSVLVAAFLYQDTNGNAAYDDGEPIRGTLQSGTTGTSLVMYYVVGCNNYEVLYQPETIGVHNGYNLLETAQVMQIRQVDFVAGTYTFSTNVPVPIDLQNVPFKIVRGSMTADPIATGTFSMAFDNSLIINVPNAACQNCANVQAGDWFVILQPYDPPAYTLQEWADLNFYSGVP